LDQYPKKSKTISMGEPTVQITMDPKTKIKTYIVQGKQSFSFIIEPGDSTIYEKFMIDYVKQAASSAS